ncbi:ADE1, partial [Symbiodinium sp. CCMP2456]
RDPSGIRPAFYYADDDFITVCSEAPLIQTVFGVQEDKVHPLPPGQALCIKRSGAWSLEQILVPLALKQCSFERIYFSRGNDAGVYREREELGRLLLPPLLKLLKSSGLSLANTVLSFIPNTSELAFLGLAKQAQDHLDREKAELVKAMGQNGSAVKIDEAKLHELLSAKVRTEKVVHKDAKIRTFIQEDSSREHLTMHAYDIHYGTVRRGQDAVVALDDSIVRGNTLKNAILRTLDKMGPTQIVVVSSCPQIRYPDVYGIDMAKLGDLAAFKAAIGLLKERGKEHIVNEVYRLCREELKAPLSSGTTVNHVQKIYESFTPEEISLRIAQDVTPDDCKAKVHILYQTVEDLHRALPHHSGDWYFTGDYPTPGGARVCCRAFALWMEGSSQRCYGINSALSFLRARRPVLVLGSGAREHALAWKLSKSPEVSVVFVGPGNGGIGNSYGQAEPFDSSPMVNVDVAISAPKFEEVITFCRQYDVGLVVVGPEQMLADGLADQLRAEDIPVFGPSKAAAQIEASKAFAKDFMKRHNIPTAEYQTFSAQNGGVEAALKYIDSVPFDVVVKASGLAAGKGVVVPETAEEAKAAVRECLEAKKFGDAGAEVVLEERMFGPECSILALCDGKRIAVLPPAQDHKRIFDGDRGPNTGGMGAFAPTPVVKPEMMEQIRKEILMPTIDGLRAEGKPFIGCLFAGLMITANGPKVIEFNCRFGDPETQAVLPLLECDLYHVLNSCAQGELVNPDTAIGVSEVPARDALHKGSLLT